MERHSKPLETAYQHVHKINLRKEQKFVYCWYFEEYCVILILTMNGNYEEKNSAGIRTWLWSLGNVALWTVKPQLQSCNVNHCYSTRDIWETCKWSYTKSKLQQLIGDSCRLTNLIVRGTGVDRKRWRWINIVGHIQLYLITGTKMPS